MRPGREGRISRAKAAKQRSRSRPVGIQRMFVNCREPSCVGCYAGAESESDALVAPKSLVREPAATPATTVGLSEAVVDDPVSKVSEHAALIDIYLALCSHSTVRRMKR